MPSTMTPQFSGLGYLHHVVIKVQPSKEAGVPEGPSEAEGKNALRTALARTYRAFPITDEQAAPITVLAEGKQFIAWDDAEGPHATRYLDRSEDLAETFAHPEDFDFEGFAQALCNDDGDAFIRKERAAGTRIHPLTATLEVEYTPHNKIDGPWRPRSLQLTTPDGPLMTWPQKR